MDADVVPGSYSLSTALKWCLQAALALDELERLDIVHGDLALR